MKDLLDIAKNIKKGPKTSIVGALMVLFSSYMIYSNEQTLTYTSVEVGLLITGLYLFLTSDGIFTKKKDEDEDTQDT